MTRLRPEFLFMAVICVVPIGLILIDAIAFDHGWAVLAYPTAIAAGLMVLTLFHVAGKFRETPREVAGGRRGAAMGQSGDLAAGAWLLSGLLLVLTLGPGLGVALFAGIYVYRQNRGLLQAGALALVIAGLAYGLFQGVFGLSMPHFPLFGR